MTEGNTVQLGIIFDRANGKYIKAASLYQIILLFSLSGTDHRSFTRWKMCKWLKENHQCFEKRSVDSLQPLVGRKIEKLIELHLVHEIGTQPISTATGQTSVYAFDSTSYFLGWLIESFSPDPVRKNKAIDKLFNILQLMLESDTPSSMSIFLKLLIRRMKIEGVFTHLVDYIIELLESGNQIRDISDLINQTLLFRHPGLDVVNKYNELWQKTLIELEPRMIQLVMFRIKLFYEQRMKERAIHLAEFEKVRFDARKRFDKIVLECGCLSCKKCIRYEEIDLTEYMVRLRYHIKGIPALAKDCPSYHSIGSLQIIDL